MDIDLEIPKNSNDIDMNQESLTKDLAFPLTLIKATHDSLYKRYCSYLLLETLRVFPSEKFKTLINSSKILMIEYPENPKQLPKQNNQKDFNEDYQLPQKRECKTSSTPCKFFKLLSMPVSSLLI
jgi:hypothetical protein